MEITYQGEREYPRGFLPAEIIPWTLSGDLTADGERLYTTRLSDPKLREAWAEVRGLAPQRRIRLQIDPGAAKLHQLPWELLRLPYSAYNLLMCFFDPKTPESSYPFSPVSSLRYCGELPGSHSRIE